MMSTNNTNPVYYVEDNQDKTMLFPNSNRHITRINKTAQRSVHHKKVVRFIVVLVLIVVAISCGALIRAFANGHEELNTEMQRTAASYTQSTADVNLGKTIVDVEKGDTLWAIASEHVSKNDTIRSYIHKLMKVNGLSKADLKEGQTLYLP